MTTSNITITNLSGEGGKHSAFLTWDFNDPNEIDYLKLDNFQIEGAFTPDFATPTPLLSYTSSFSDILPFTGVTKYYRVRAKNLSGDFGPWSDVVSVQETSADDSWGGEWSSLPFIEVSAQAGSVTAVPGSILYKTVGEFVQFQLSWFLTSVVGASGWLRCGRIPVSMRAGVRVAVNGSVISGSNFNYQINAEVVDVGGDTFVEVFNNDGSFAGVENYLYIVTGFFEKAA
jgi:hypothetical protein